MAELFKNIYNDRFFERFTNIVLAIQPNFNKTQFIKDIYTDNWEQKELKQRMRHITTVLNTHLSPNFEQNVELLIAVIQYIEQNNIKQESIEYMFLPDFIEVYGMNHYNVSVKAMEQITQFTSCEFAVRPFIIAYPDKMLTQMKAWSTHKHPMVRRLATEGCRPRLPWAMALPELKKDPTPILPILETLKGDVSESVRRSVANNLNDISKDNPEIVMQLAKKWMGTSKEIDWVVKHASRTLLKQGNSEIMELFGFGSIENIKITDFNIHTPKVSIGNYLEFSFKLKNISSPPSKIRLEYGLYYQKANGTLSKKVFKISEKQYDGQSTTAITRKQSFKIITTRRYHVGLHQVSLIINGQELEAFNFELIS
ncbi:3-methyladenine DNA glycosylase AlkC [Tenacibaculum sp. 190524A02b]|uniref:3-methyladenine DNA glycosylase AlkC n=1 Tax=Tenacibaculum vairaonense TaxID=3137860 RepID=A0ABM9PIZ8_9FLAO